jgi:hypothetical protein
VPPVTPVVPCLGGWCRARTGCAHHVAPSSRDEPAERLCPKGQDDPLPVKAPA